MASIKEQFWRYAPTVQIPSKDEGLIRFKPFGTQTYLINEILDSIEAGVHEIYINKPRQVGATTAIGIFDTFWLQKFNGMVGQLVADSDDNRAFFRSIISEIVKSSPKQYRYRVLQNNRNQIFWSNKSRLLFQTASAKALGRGRGLNFFHGTEVAYWNGAERISGLRASFSERHPNACFIWESTANGYNHWYELWKQAERAVTVKAIFVPWWRHELYSLDPNSKEFKVYWDSRLTGDERVWQSQILKRWGVTLTPEQWAWRRWKLAEKIGDEITMHAEYPTLPEHAFQASGSPFLGSVAQARLQDELSRAPDPEGYNYVFGGFIEQTEVNQTDPQMAQLLLWEKPDPKAFYVVAADPAFGASEDSDMSVIQVWRCGRHGLVQAAEFASNSVTTQQFAWTILHLCGSFMPSAFLILELNGPGMTVWNEIERLRSWGWGTTRRQEFQDALAAIQNYLWKRPDSMGISHAWQWKTNANNKIWLMNHLRDNVLTGRIAIRSRDLVEELSNIRQQGDRFESEGKTHDDRAITLGLAIEMWQNTVVPILETLPPQETDPLPEQVPVHERMVRDLFARLGAG